VSDRPTAAPTTDRSAPPRPRRVPVAALVTALVVVVAIVGIGIALSQDGDDDAGEEPTATASTSPEALVPAPPATPVDLDARAKPFAVTLRWSPDPSAGAIEGYTVYRNGSEIGTVTGDGPGTFVDDDAVPLIRSTYAVAAFGQDDVASEPAEVRVKTPPGPLSLARLEGTFNVKIQQTSAFGYTSTRPNSTGGWTFSPRCKRGACDVKVAAVFRGSSSVAMERRSATYRANGTAKLGVRCSGTPSTSTYSLEVEVVKANTVEGVWHAVTIEGTFVHREAAQLGCVAGGADAAFTGKLVDL
jgi:hypothetical protein